MTDLTTLRPHPDDLPPEPTTGRTAVPTAVPTEVPTARAATRSGPSAGPGRWWRRGGAWSVLLALPLLLSFGYFSWWPIIRGVIISFQQTNFLDSEWVGLANFEYVLSDPLLPQATLNTLLFAGVSLLIGFPLPLFLAVFMAELRGSRRLYNVLAYLPVVIPPVAAILMWKTFYSPGSEGLFNSVLGTVGLGPFLWLNSPDTVIPAIVVEATWAWAGNTVIIYVAALTSVRTELYEAAELDGAGVLRRVWSVTIPQIRGVILVMLLLQIIGVLQVFTEPQLFTGGGPENASITILMLVYNYGFLNGNFGAATALSVLLALALALVSLAYHYVTRRWNTDD